MQNILVVDDLRLYQDTPDSQFMNVHYARNSTEAVEMLQSGEVHFDAIFLDHDLGGDDTTMPVVDYLTEHADEYRDTPIFVHTTNPVGASKILLSFGAFRMNARRVIATQFFKGVIDEA
jgi:CheY-like chemotaxis protein